MRADEWNEEVEGFRVLCGLLLMCLSLHPTFTHHRPTSLAHDPTVL
jgi:hypothetical protein